MWPIQWKPPSSFLRYWSIACMLYSKNSCLMLIFDNERSLTTQKRCKLHMTVTFVCYFKFKVWVIYLTCHQTGKVIILLLRGQMKDRLVFTRTVQHPASTVLSHVVLYSLQISYNVKQRTLWTANSFHSNIWSNNCKTQVKTLHIWLPHLHILFWTF